MIPVAFKPDCAQIGKKNILSDSAAMIAKSEFIEEENPQWAPATHSCSQWSAYFPVSPRHPLQVSFITSLSREAGRPAGAALLSKLTAQPSSTKLRLRISQGLWGQW